MPQPLGGMMGDTHNTAVQNDLATRPAHTPGEWKSEVVGTSSGQWLVVYVDDPSWDGGKRELFESETVSTVFGKRNTLNPRFRDTQNAAETRANVALAIAAPDMLAFVRKQHAETNCICGIQSKFKGTRLETNLECTKCETARIIAKAEGR